MADVYIGRNPNDGTSPLYVTGEEMLETTQKNAAKRPKRFWAKKLALMGKL
jgi:hypothetical protein